MAFPTDSLTVLVELYIDGAWVDITEDVYLRTPITVTRGRADEAARVDPSKCVVTINNRAGKYSPKRPSSPYFGLIGRNTPLRVTATTPAGATSVRFVGEVSAWPSRWDVSGADVWVPIEAAGVMRRLSQGTPPARSALRRLIEAHDPADFWPLTDGEDAIQGQNASGSNPIRAVDRAGTLFKGQPNWGKGTLASWLEPVVELPATSTGILAVVPTLLDVSGGWAIDVCRAGTGDNADEMFITVGGEGTASDPRLDWGISHALGSLVLTRWSYSSGVGSGTGLASYSSPEVTTGGPHHIRLSVVPSGTAGVWTLYLDGVEVASGTEAGMAGAPTRITHEWGHAGEETLNVGHIVYWADPPDAADMYRALVGYTGERAGRRIERLCSEEDLALAVAGDLDDTVVMGPQRPDGVLALMQSAADVDGGVLGEAREVLGMAYRTGRSKYNQGV